MIGSKNADMSPEMVAMIVMRELGRKPYTLPSHTSSSSLQPKLRWARVIRDVDRNTLDMMTAPSVSARRCGFAHMHTQDKVAVSAHSAKGGVGQDRARNGDAGEVDG